MYFLIRARFFQVHLRVVTPRAQVLGNQLTHVPFFTTDTNFEYFCVFRSECLSAYARLICM